MKTLALKKYDDGKEYNLTPDGTHYSTNTPIEIVEALEYARRAGLRVRLWHGYTEAYPGEGDKIGQAWPEEHEVCGRINRTTSRHSPILVYNARSTGGSLISTDSIIGIKTSTRWLYRHADFNAGDWQAYEDNSMEGYGASASHNRGVHARFKTIKQAQIYCDFMTGKRFNR